MTEAQWCILLCLLSYTVQHITVLLTISPIVLTLHSCKGKVVSSSVMIKGTSLRGNVTFYWNISRGTEAVNRGMGTIASIASVKYQACDTILGLKYRLKMLPQ